MMNRQDDYWHGVYCRLPEVIGNAISEAYTDINSTLRREVDLDPAYDDRAECLVAAITRYVCESNPDNAGVIAALKEPA